MKKTIFSLIIIGLSLLGNAQDKILVDENFATFPPTNWTTIDDAGGSGTTANWAKSGYPIVLDDVVEQEEWLISPTISLDAANSYQISFDYFQNYTDYGTNDLTLLVSFDNGVTWDDASANADEVWSKSNNGNFGNNYWYNSGFYNVNAPAVTGGAKFAFIYTSTDGDLMQAIDNIILQEDNGGGFVDYRTYTFENGIAAPGFVWTKLSNQAGAGSTQTWHDNFLAKVDEDATLVQDEWLLSPKFKVSNSELTDLVVSYSYYALLNSLNLGVSLYVANQNDWNNFILIDDTHFNGNSIRNIIETSITLSNGYHYNLGDSLQFALVFQTSVAGGVDFYLENFRFETQFNEGSVNADATITLGSYDEMVYPLYGKYNSDLKEGFWTVEPDGWTNTGTNSGVEWYRSGWINNHDYSASIDTVGSNEAGLNETLTSEVITINYPSVGASYLLSFDWRTETNLNAGTNTDPLLGGGVDYDFADIKMEIRTNGGVWTQIWQEDDQAVLDATTLTTSSSYHNSWNGFQQYLDNPGLWYRAVLDLNNYITPATTSLQIRFNYNGSGMYGGYFNVDNLYVMQTQNPEFDFEAAEPFSVTDNFLVNYNRIPISQINNPYQLGAVITNNGVASFSNNNMFAYVNENFSGEETFGYRILTPALLPVNSTKYITVNNVSSSFANGMNLTEGSNYALRYSVSDLNGNAFNESVSFDVTSTEFRKNTGGADGYSITTDNITGGIGTLFEFKNSDVIDQVTVILGDVNNSSDFNLSVIKVSSPFATSGSLIYNSPLVRMINDFSTYTFTDDLNVSAGYYIFMFNQLDNYPLNIAYDENTYTNGVIYRGNATNIYTDANNTSELMVSLFVKQNDYPEILSALTDNEKVLFASQDVEIVFSATDANDDDLSWTLDAASPAWLIDWIVFTDNGDGTATLSGTPTTDHLGTSSIQISVSDGRGGTDNYAFSLKVISQIASYSPDYTEYFDGNDGTVPVNWSTLNDQVESGSDFHWGLFSNRMNIYGDYDEAQDEWIISPPISLINEAKSLDTSYRLEFDWEVYDFNYFCLGIPGVLGSSSNGGYNLADVTLLVSTDNGLTWSDPIWKEDDPNLVAPVTEGILGGEKWGYSNQTTYTSKIDLTAYVGETIVFAFRYQGKSAEYWQNSFAINNFKVLRNNQVDISVITFRDYSNLPERQVDQVNGEKFYAYIINQGIYVPEGATYTLSLPEVGYEETFELNAAFFATGDTQLVEYTFYPQANINQSYYFNTSVDADNNATSGMTSHQEEIYIHPSQMNLEYSSNVEERSFGYYDGLGVAYELKNADHLYRIFGNFGSSTISGTPISISIIKVNNFGDSSGELVATIDDEYGSPLSLNASGSYYFYITNDQDYNSTLYMEAGKYIIMFNQLDDNYPIYLNKANNSYYFNKYYRGNFSEIYQDDYDQGHLMTNLYFDSNDAPRFVDNNDNTITSYTADVLVGQSGNFTIIANDYDEFDVLGFVQVTDPSFLAPSWLSFSFNADTAFMVIADNAPSGQYPAQLKVGDGVDTTTLSITIKINGPQYMPDEFYETFNSWNESYPKITTSNNVWTLKKGTTSESNNYWSHYSNDTRIYNDNSFYQNEWLISPYVYFTAPSNDTTYWLNFKWYVEDVSRMLGGTKDVIGSGDEFIDFNYADLRVKISIDGGNTWTLLWQEDDEDLVKSANSDLVFPYSSNYYYNKYVSKIDITSYAGQPILIGIQYEGMGGSSVGLDEIEIERVDPYVDLQFTRYDVLPYYIPIKQVKNFDVKVTITNKGTALSTVSSLSAQITNSGGDLNPAYEETMPMAPLAGGASLEYVFPMAQTTYGQYNWSYNFDFNIYSPYYVNNTYNSNVSDRFYGYDHDNVNGALYSEPGLGLGQVFQIYEEDLMTQVYLYSYSYNYLKVQVVKLSSDDATSGELVYTSSPLYANYGWVYLDIEDVTLEPGYYAIFVTDSEENESFPIGYNTYSGVNAGTYIMGDASGFEVVQHAQYLNFRLVFDNSSPYFANSEGNNISLEDQKAMVGIEFITLIRAIDDDADDNAAVEGLTLPSWLTVELVDGFYQLKGTPTEDDLGENLVVLRATDGTTYDQDDFIISVEVNPAPEFTTAPSIYAFQGKNYSYQATAVDKFGDVVTLTATLPAWLSVTGSGSSITISGTPTAANIGNFAVKITATDDHGMTSEQLFTITVVANSAPEFVSTPLTTGTINVVYSYYIAANDANSSDVIAITAPTRPTWLTLSATGNGRASLSGIPTAGGTFNVVLVATDAVGATATQSFSIVVESNAAPVFASTAITSATEDVLYTYSISTTDADGDYMYFDAKVIPNWLVLTVSGNGTATLQGIPTQQYVGNNNVSLAVGDGVNKTEQNFTISVTEVNDAPLIVSPSINSVAVGNAYQYLVEGFDEEGATLEYTAQLPSWLTLIDYHSGKALVSGSPNMENVGEYEISIMASDGNSQTEQVYRLNVTGVTDAIDTENESISIYPNPTTGKFTITNSEGSIIMVFNLAGEKVYQVENNSLAADIDLTGIQEGNYVVKVILKDKVIHKTISIIK